MNLVEALLQQRDRLQLQTIPAYESCGPGGALALELTLRPALKEATEALGSGDAIRMLRAYLKLKELES